MLQFVFQKLKSKRWMVLSLLVGNLLLIAIASAGPLYTQGVLQRTLMQSLNAVVEEDGIYPGVVQAQFSYYQSKDPATEFPKMEKAGEIMADMPRSLGIPGVEFVTRRTMKSIRAKYSAFIENRMEETSVSLTSMSGVSDHIRITHGTMYSGEVTDRVIEVIVSQALLMKKDLVLGEELELVKLKNDSRENYRIRIVGIYEMAEASDLYWAEDPAGWTDVCLMDEDLFTQIIANPQRGGQNFTVQWRAVLDYTQFTEEQALGASAAFRRQQEQLTACGAEKVTAEFEPVLNRFNAQADRIRTTLWVLLAPVFALLAAFLFMVSRQMLDMERNEISVFQSRGASRGQIIAVYLLQSAVLVAIAILPGVLLGMLICRIIGSSNAFLEFVQRTGLPVKLDGRVLAVVGAAAVFSVAAMVLPAFRFAKVGIVESKRAKNRKSGRPWWQTACVDLLLLGASVYGLYQFRGQENYLAQQVMDGAGLDPLLYICSSLFMVGAGLLFVRLFPWLIRLIFWLGKRWWSPSAYASFLRILRTRDNQGFIMVFLVLTVAMGIFSAQTARTINANAEEQLRYSMGADVVMQDVWHGEHYGGTVSYTEPNSEKYRLLEGVKSSTKVLVDPEVTLTVGSGTVRNVTLMGIHTKEFGQTAWFKESLMEIHWYDYLNAMSQNPRALLVSSNLRDRNGLRVGDVLSFTNGDGMMFWGVIYGFVDYWPAYTPSSLVLGSDGAYHRQTNSLIVANLAQLQASWGMRPYELWLDVEDSTGFLYDYIVENNVRLWKFEDFSAELVSMKNDPVFQGTNGVLTVGFVVVLILCAAGFLIYWILSIQSRTLQFGIFRAMGMRMGEVLSMLVTEQIFISGLAIAAGAAVGKLASRLYIPLIQTVYSAADRAIPLEIISDPSDDLRLTVVIGLMIAVCMVILSVLISRIRISQALKLGED